jgi:SAM-dependent methyltransferase
VTRWDQSGGAGQGRQYAARFEELAASGVDMHGEATRCTLVQPPPARVLDAGCGTGRVAIRLAELGFDVVGVDVDPSMLTEAAAAAPGLTWIEADLASFTGSAGFDLVVAAGNVIPLVAPGTEAAVVANLAAQLAPGGALLAGFGLDAAHLPIPEAPVSLPGFDIMCSAAGLVLEQRWATWDGLPYDGGGYAVSLHRRPR